MATKSKTIVLSLSASNCYELVKELGHERGFQEKDIDNEGIIWAVQNYTLETWITPISENKTKVEIVASSSSLFDILGTLDQHVKTFAIQLKKKQNKAKEPETVLAIVDKTPMTEPIQSQSSISSSQSKQSPTESKKVKTRISTTLKITRETGQRNMIFGALWCIGGILMTAASYAYALSPEGGTYYIIFRGAIIFGGFQFLLGLYQFSTPPNISPDSVRNDIKSEEESLRREIGVGLSSAEIKKKIGEPLEIIPFGEGKFLYKYPMVNVSFSDDKVTTIEYLRLSKSNSNANKT
jgi:hypothetical protein